MDLQFDLASVAHVAVATVWGSMVFFAAVVAPRAFEVLDEEAAGRFLRELFPHYYSTLGSLSAVACALLAAASAGGGGPWTPEALIMLVTAAAFLGSRWFLMPRINDRRDAAKAGDPDAERNFTFLHRLSVWINTAQLLAVLWVLWRLG